GYPAAFEKAKSPDYYFAMASVTGPDEVWYVMSNDSYAAVGEGMKRQDKDPVLSAELNRLALADADYISAVETIRAVGRPDLSVGDFPDLSKVRFNEISVFRIRPGREMEFEEIAKAYASAFKRAVPKGSYRIYEVTAGMPLPSYLIFSSLEDYGEFDKRREEGEAVFKGANADEMAKLKKFADVTERVENNHYRIDPGQSYVSKAVREKDPEFWMPKP